MFNQQGAQVLIFKISITQERSFALFQRILHIIFVTKLYLNFQIMHLQQNSTQQPEN